MMDLKLVFCHINFESFGIQSLTIPKEHIQYSLYVQIELYMYDVCRKDPLFNPSFNYTEYYYRNKFV